MTHLFHWLIDTYTHLPPNSMALIPLAYPVGLGIHLVPYKHLLTDRLDTQWQWVRVVLVNVVQASVTSV